MITLIKGARVYAPQDMGTCDVLLAGTQIADIAEQIDLSGERVKVIDGSKKVVTPGLVDTLVHVSGGGGEGGFHTRTPAMELTEATLAGVTTVIGALGTDGTSRTLPDLLAKAHGLQVEGISTYCYTGSYQLPARTLTGSVNDDVMLIDKIIGIGEVAIADHRGSQPSAAELARVAADARVGGMLSGKAGIVSIHVGDSDSQLTLLHEVVQSSDIPATQFYPTHINRNQSLLDAGIAWTEAGGYIDMTTSTNEQFIAEGEIPAAKAVAYCLAKGVSVAQITMSSDGNASLPVFDNAGRLVGLEVGRVSSLFDSFRELVFRHDLDIATALKPVTTSPADILKLPHKGRLMRGADADVLLLNADTLGIDMVFAQGKLLVDGGKACVKGTFEA